MNDTKLKKVKVGAMMGYSLSSIEKELGPKNYKEFLEWMTGQTIGLLNDESVVYIHDFNRYVSGLSPVW